MIETLQQKRRRESILQLAQPKPLLSSKHKAKRNLLAEEKIIVRMKVFPSTKDDLDEEDS